MRKIFSLTLVLVLMLSMLGACAKPVDDGFVKIKVAHHAGLAGLSVPAADSLNKFFEEEGLKVEWLKFTSGPTEVAAMVAGDLQFGYLGHGAHTLAAAGKIDIISLNNLGNSERIIVRNSSGIKTIAELKGKQIATQAGTSGEVILNLALKSVGLTKDDIKFVGMDITGAVSAFIAGKVDAIACWDIHSTNVISKVGAEQTTIICKTDDFKELAAFPGSWAVTPQYAKDNEETVIKFLRALNKCYDYSYDNFDAVVKAASEFGEVPYDTLNASRTMAYYHNEEMLKAMVENGELLNIYQKQLDYFLSSGTIETVAVQAKDYLRLDLLKKAFTK